MRITLQQIFMFQAFRYPVFQLELFYRFQVILHIDRQGFNDQLILCRFITRQIEAAAMILVQDFINSITFKQVAMTQLLRK